VVFRAVLKLEPCITLYVARLKQVGLEQFEMSLENSSVSQQIVSRSCTSTQSRKRYSNLPSVIQLAL